MIAPNTGYIRQILADPDVDEKLKVLLNTDTEEDIAQALNLLATIYPDKYGDIDIEIPVETATTDYEEEFASTTKQHRQDGIIPGLKIAIYDPDFYSLPGIKESCIDYIGKYFYRYGEKAHLFFGTEDWMKHKLFKREDPYGAWVIQNKKKKKKKGKKYWGGSRIPGSIHGALMEELKVDIYYTFVNDVAKIEYTFNPLITGDHILEQFLRETRPSGSAKYDNLTNADFNRQLQAILADVYQELKEKGAIAEDPDTYVQVYYDAY